MKSPTIGYETDLAIPTITTTTNMVTSLTSTNPSTTRISPLAVVQETHDNEAGTKGSKVIRYTATKEQTLFFDEMASTPNESIASFHSTVTDPIDNSSQIHLTADPSLPTAQTTSSTKTVPFNFEEEASPPSNAIEQEDIPPDGGYGWVVCLCVFLINAHTWGVNSAWGVFLAYYLANNTFPNASHLEYALIGGLSVSQSLMISPVIATSTRKLGTRTTLLIGTVLTAVSFLTASFSTQIWHLFLTQGICFGWGMGFLYVPASATLPQWFSSRRSLANGLASSGAGVGGIVYNLAAGAGVASLGWQWTYRILACCAFAANLLSAYFLHDRNRVVKPTRAAFNYKEYAHVEVLLIVAWGVLTELGYIVLLYSLPNYASSIGLSPKQGSIVGALLSLGLGIGRPVVGYYSDALGRINMATLMTFLCSVFCLTLWIPTASSSSPFPLLLTFAILAGTVCGTFWATVAPVMAEVVGLQRLPSVFGMVIFALVLPTTFAEPIALEIVGATRGYLTSQVFVGVMFLLGAGCMVILRSWKLRELEEKRKRDRIGDLEFEEMSRTMTLESARYEMTTNNPAERRSSVAVGSDPTTTTTTARRAAQQLQQQQQQPSSSSRTPQHRISGLFAPRRLFYIGRV